MNKIYLVSTGEYSDYDVLGAFSTEKKAEDFCSTFHSDRPDIREYVLDKFDDIIEACRDKKVFCVEMALVDGAVKRVKEETGELWATQMVLENKVVIANAFIIARVFANDEKHAVKIVAERRTQVVVKMNTDG